MNRKLAPLMITTSTQLINDVPGASDTDFRIEGTLDLGGQEVRVTGPNVTIEGDPEAEEKATLSNGPLLFEAGTGEVRDIRLFMSVPGSDFTLEFRSDHNTATGLTIEDNAGGGVLIHGNSNWIWSSMIRNNAGPGVVIESGTGNAILETEISGNGGLGIDVGGDGVGFNDLFDADIQEDSGFEDATPNYPTVIGVDFKFSTTIEGIHHSTPDSGFRLEFFSNQECDPSGFGEGEHYLGFTHVTTDAEGNARIEVTFEEDVPADHFITATATNMAGSTSEFSPCAAFTAIEDPTYLYFPFYREDASSFNGYAVSNFSGASVKLEFTAFGALGALIQQATNPGRFDLADQNQLAKTASQIFQVDPATSPPGWIQLVVDQEAVGSFFQLGSNDLQQLDGGVAWEEPVKRMIFTRVFDGATAYRGQTATTRLTLANPTPIPSTVELTYVAGANGPAGTAPQGASQTVNRTLPPRVFLDESPSEIFGQELSGGYIMAEVTQGGEVIGFERVELPDHKTLLGLNGALESDATELFSAQLAYIEGVVFTNIQLVNSSDQTRNLTLSAIAEAGGPLADPVDLALGPGESISRDASQLFGLAGPAGRLPAGALFVGSLRVVADGPGVLGDVVFGDPAGFTNAAALPLQSEPFLEAVFSQVANIPGFFTGLALYVPGDEAAQVLIEVFAPDGSKVGEAMINLAAGTRFSRTVDQLVPTSAGQAGGFIRVTSDKGLIGQQLFGTSTLSLLSAVPPKVVSLAD